MHRNSIYPHYPSLSLVYFMQQLIARIILPSFAMSNISLANPAPGTRIEISFLELKLNHDTLSTYYKINTLRL